MVIRRALIVLLTAATVGALVVGGISYRRGVPDNTLWISSLTEAPRLQAVVSLTGHHPEPHQVNLADDPSHADKLAEMEAALLAEQRRLDDPYRLWNQPSR